MKGPPEAHGLERRIVGLFNALLNDPVESHRDPMIVIRCSFSRDGVRQYTASVPGVRAGLAVDGPHAAIDSLLYAIAANYEAQARMHKTEGPEPWAVITRTDEPSPETGARRMVLVGDGFEGDAPSYEAARDAAVAEIQRRMDRRMAVL